MHIGALMCINQSVHKGVKITFIVHSDNVGAEPRLVSSVCKTTNPDQTCNAGYKPHRREMFSILSVSGSDSVFSTFFFFEKCKLFLCEFCKSKCYTSEVKEGETVIRITSADLQLYQLFQSHTCKNLRSILKVDDMCQLIYGAWLIHDIYIHYYTESYCISIKVISSSQLSRI